MNKVVHITSARTRDDIRIFKKECISLSKSGINESINKIFDDLSMPYEMIPELSEYCNSKNIEFMSTPFSVEDAK